MAKKTPAWQLMGLAEQPPADAHGYVNYGTVWSVDDPPAREHWKEVVRLGLWSWHYWGKKVRRDIEHERAAGRSGTLVQRLADRVALLLVAATDGLYQRLRPHLEG